MYISLTIIIVIAALILALPVSAYSGYRTALGPEEEERDAKEVLKKYRWRIRSKEAWLLPVCALLVLTVWFFDTEFGKAQIDSWLLLEFMLYFLCTLFLAGLSYVDLMIFEIPPLYDILIATLGFIRLITDLSHWYDYLTGAVLVSGIFFLIALFSGGRAMGGGDIKLMAALGFLIGWKEILLVMGIGAILGSVIHGLIMLLTKKEHLLAFGPYLSAGGVIVMCVGEKIIEAYMAYVQSAIRP